MKYNTAKSLTASAKFLLFLLFVSFAYANEKDDISKYASEYFKLLESKDYSDGLDYIYPQLFNYVPKDLMVEAMENMDKDSMVKISFSGFSLDKISSIVTLEGIGYANVEYTFNMIMGVNYEENDDKELAIEFTLSSLKSQFGEENVVYDDKKSAYHISSHSNMFAIQDPTYTGWKFLENKEGLYEILDQMIPEKIWEEFGLTESEINE